jgi:hypothetical protein
MTPQETELVNELFDRLAQLESAARDPEAERLIADGLRQAPHAPYALVQTVLVQDEAIKRANARIEELQAELERAPEPAPRGGSFLDSMRDAFAGRPQRASVPTVRPAATAPPPWSPAAPQPGFAPMPPPGYGAAPYGGGSFLGSAASTAAGVVGGALLLDSIRSMFGDHHSTATNPSAFADASGNNDLARQAGIDHIGDHLHDPGNDRGPDTSHQPSDTDDGSQFDSDDGTYQVADDDDGMFGDDGSGGGGDYSDA